MMLDVKKEDPKVITQAEGWGVCPLPHLQALHSGCAMQFEACLTAYFTHTTEAEPPVRVRAGYGPMRRVD